MSVTPFVPWLKMSWRIVLSDWFPARPRRVALPAAMSLRRRALDGLALPPPPLLSQRERGLGVRAGPVVLALAMT